MLTVLERVVINELDAGRSEWKIALEHAKLWRAKILHVRKGRFQAGVRARVAQRSVQSRLGSESRAELDQVEVLADGAYRDAAGMAAGRCIEALDWLGVGLLDLRSKLSHGREGL